jgi:hypothetical protein
MEKTFLKNTKIAIAQIAQATKALKKRHRPEDLRLSF